MYDEKSIEIGRSIFLLDILSTTIAYIFSIWLKEKFLVPIEADYFSHLALLPLFLLFIISSLSYFQAYESPCNLTFIEYGWAIFRSVALGISALLTILFILKIDYISRLVILSFAVIDFAFLLLIRIIFIRYHKNCVSKGKSTSRVLIVGTGERALELAESLKEQSEWGVEVIGHLDPDAGRVGKEIYGSKVIGTINDIGEVLRSNVVDEVIIAIPRSMLNDAEPIAEACEEEGIKLRFMADLFNLEVARIKLIRLGKIPLLTMEPVAQDEIQLMIKRIFDITTTIVVLPAVLLIMSIIAIAIKFDSPGPIFFVQQRVGFKKRHFPLLKFRSMYSDAEARLPEIEHLNEAEGPIFKIKNDPRVTRIGKILRKTSLDELPQLFNVLRGEMSLVGPRPMSKRDVNLFDKGIQRKRFSVRPGITCLWQISGRSNLPFSRWLELDLRYIENWSLILDLKILFMTIPAVLTSKGAE